MFRRAVQSLIQSAPTSSLVTQAVATSQWPAVACAARCLEQTACAPDGSDRRAGFASGSCLSVAAGACMEDALQQQATPSWQSYLQRKAWELMLPMPVLQPDDSIMMTSQQTYRPKVLKRKRCHGFLKRNSTKAGRRTMARRKAKGRWIITV